MTKEKLNKAIMLDRAIKETEEEIKKYSKCQQFVP